MRRIIYFVCAVCAWMLCHTVSAFAEDHSVIVLSQGDQSVYDTDPATGKILHQVRLGGAPTAAVFSWDEQSLFVSVPDQGYISIVNLPSFKEARRLSIPELKSTSSSAGFRGALATTPDYKKLYVSVPGGLKVFDQHLLIYNPEFKQPDKTIPLQGRDGQSLLVHGPTGKLYCAFQHENQVVVIDTNTDKVLKTIPVKGGPTDIAFFVGEAWIAADDGSVSIIDTNKDEVVKTIETGGKGSGSIAAAHDLRYLAVSHNDTGDVTILQPMTKEVVGSVKVEKGPLAVAFAPAGTGSTNLAVYQTPGHPGKFLYPPTNQLYVAGQSGIAVVDLDKMTVSAHQKVGQQIVGALIHFTYPDAFTPPREGTAQRVLETETYTLYDNSWFEYDVSPIHEHRTDMVGIYIDTGMAKMGCWDPACPEKAIKIYEQNGLTYHLREGTIRTYTGDPRYTLHQEGGESPTPRRAVVFMPKNNYYRQMNPKKTSDFADRPEFTKMYENPRAWLWNLMLIPGRPVHFPKCDCAIVYFGGGLIRETHNGLPEIGNRYFAATDVDTTERTIELLSNERIPITVIEFK